MSAVPPYTNLYQYFPDPLGVLPTTLDPNGITLMGSGLGETRNMTWCTLYAISQLAASGGGGPVTLGPGSVSAGAYVAGALVDGAIVTLGLKTDATATFPLGSSVSMVSLNRNIAVGINTLTTDLCAPDIHNPTGTPGVLGNANDLVALDNTGKYSLMGFFKRFMSVYALKLLNLPDNGQAPMASSLPVTIANDQTPIPVFINGPLGQGPMGSSIPVAIASDQSILNVQDIVSENALSNIQASIQNLHQGNYNVVNVTSAGTTTIKPGSGKLGGFSINTPDPTGSIVMTDGGNPVGVYVADKQMPFTGLDFVFNTNLVVVISFTTGIDINFYVL